MIVAVTFVAVVAAAAVLLLYLRITRAADQLATQARTLLRPALNYTATWTEPGPPHLTPDPADPRMLTVRLVSSGGSPAVLLATHYTIRLHDHEVWEGDTGQQVVTYLAEHDLVLDRDYHLTAFSPQSRLDPGWRDIVFATTLPAAHRFAQFSCRYFFTGLAGPETKDVHFVPLPADTARLPLPPVRDPAG